jgi:hypothetical protein
MFLSGVVGPDPLGSGTRNLLSRNVLYLSYQNILYELFSKQRSRTKIHQTMKNVSGCTV